MVSLVAFMFLTGKEGQFLWEEGSWGSCLYFTFISFAKVGRKDVVQLQSQRERLCRNVAEYMLGIQKVSHSTLPISGSRGGKDLCLMSQRGQKGEQTKQGVLWVIEPLPHLASGCS